MSANCPQELSFKYAVTPQISVHTTVSGGNDGAYNQATIQILSGGVPMWFGAVNQNAQIVTYPSLTVGDATLDPGTFTLTIPSDPQPGSVRMDGKLTSATNKTEIHAQVAHWVIPAMAGTNA